MGRSDIAVFSFIEQLGNLDDQHQKRILNWILMRITFLLFSVLLFV